MFFLCSMFASFNYQTWFFLIWHKLPLYFMWENGMFTYDMSFTKKRYSDANSCVICACFKKPSKVNHHNHQRFAAWWAAAQSNNSQISIVEVQQRHSFCFIERRKCEILPFVFQSMPHLFISSRPVGWSLRCSSTIMFSIYHAVVKRLLA